MVRPPKTPQQNIFYLFPTLNQGKIFILFFETDNTGELFFRMMLLPWKVGGVLNVSHQTNLSFHNTRLIWEHRTSSHTCGGESWRGSSLLGVQGVPRHQLCHALGFQGHNYKNIRGTPKMAEMGWDRTKEKEKGHFTEATQLSGSRLPPGVCVGNYAIGG